MYLQIQVETTGKEGPKVQKFIVGPFVHPTTAEHWMNEAKKLDEHDELKFEMVSSVTMPVTAMLAGDVEPKRFYDFFIASLYPV